MCRWLSALRTAAVPARPRTCNPPPQRSPFCRPARPKRERDPPLLPRPQRPPPATQLRPNAGFELGLVVFDTTTRNFTFASGPAGERGIASVCFAARRSAMRSRREVSLPGLLSGAPPTSASYSRSRRGCARLPAPSPAGLLRFARAVLLAVLVSSLRGARRISCSSRSPFLDGFLEALRAVPARLELALRAPPQARG